MRHVQQEEVRCIAQGPRQAEGITGSPCTCGRPAGDAKQRPPRRSSAAAAAAMALSESLTVLDERSSASSMLPGLHDAQA